MFTIKSNEFPYKKMDCEIEICKCFFRLHWFCRMHLSKIKHFIIYVICYIYIIYNNMHLHRVWVQLGFS